MQWMVCAIVCTGFLSLGPFEPLRAAAWVASLWVCYSATVPWQFVADCLTKGRDDGTPPLLSSPTSDSILFVQCHLRDCSEFSATSSSSSPSSSWQLGPRWIRETCQKIDRKWNDQTECWTKSSDFHKYPDVCWLKPDCSWFKSSFWMAKPCETLVKPHLTLLNLLKSQYVMGFHVCFTILNPKFSPCRNLLARRRESRALRPSFSKIRWWQLLRRWREIGKFHRNPIENPSKKMDRSYMAKSPWKFSCGNPFIEIDSPLK